MSIFFLTYQFLSRENWERIRSIEYFRKVVDNFFTEIKQIISKTKIFAESIPDKLMQKIFLTCKTNMSRQQNY